jgi:hypothetical protein
MGKSGEFDVILSFFEQREMDHSVLSPVLG